MPNPARRPPRTCRALAPTGLLLALAAGVLPAAAADGVGLAAFSSAGTGEPPAAWKFATLPNKKPTRFSVVELDGARVLKVEADDTYGTLVHAVRARLSEQATLAWRWRVDQLVDAADLKTRAGDDAAAKVCVFFAFDSAKLPIGERTRLALARSSTGQDVPAQALCYVWDNKQAEGAGLVNAFTRRVRFIVLQSGTAKLGQWTAQKRSVAADYLRMFGDEAEGQVPEVSGIAVSADADNTHGQSLAYVGDITLTP